MRATRGGLTAAILAIALALTAAGCGDSEPANDSTNANGAGDSGDDSGNAGNASDDSEEPAETGPITVTDSRGEQTLDEPAVDVVALEWAYVEDLQAVGVTPAGVADVAGYNTWVSSAPIPETVTDVGTRQEPSLDEIAKLAPDLIIAEGDTVRENLPQLNEIADVLVFEGTNPEGNFEHMRENFTQIAAAVGKDAEAENVLADLDAKIDSAAQELDSAGVAGEEFAVAHGWVASGAVVVRMFGTASLASEVTEKLGLTNAWADAGDRWGLAETDVEGLTELGDPHFLYVAPDGDVFGEDLADNPIWKGLEFVQNDKVHEIDGGTWFFGGPVSTSQYVDEVVGALAK